jgi:hypothetical protein
MVVLVTTGDEVASSISLYLVISLCALGFTVNHYKAVVVSPIFEIDAKANVARQEIMQDTTKQEGSFQDKIRQFATILH